MCAQIQPVRLVSLSELMDEYNLKDLAALLGAVINACRDFSTADQLNKPISNDEFCRNLGTCLDGLQITCHLFHADPSLLQNMETLATGLVKGTADKRSSVLHARLETIIEGVMGVLGNRKFLFIPPEDVSFWENPTLFGPVVQLVFTERTISEIREAGNCYATNRNTACVFHCMRVAEYGLRMLAKRLRIQLTHKGKECPVEYAEWDKVITQIKIKISAARQTAKGKKREDMLNFYSNAADHCEYMKDIWRNEVSHTRRLYSRPEAFAVLDRVRTFMQMLAIKDIPKGLKEYERTRKIKKGLEAVTPPSR